MVPTQVSNLPAPGRRPVIVFDGRESAEGRALLAVSALYWCTEWLPRVDLRFCDVSDEAVILALRLFEADSGTAVKLLPHSAAHSPLASADLYAAVAFRTTKHLRLDEAAESGIPAFVAVQFPSAGECNASTLLRQHAAFDPRAFAEDLRALVERWE